MTKKKKSGSNGGLRRVFLKFGQKKLIVLVLAVAAIAVSAYFVINSVGADSLMTASCSGKKGNCTEQDFPVPTGDQVTYSVVARDAKTKEVLAGLSEYETTSIKHCYKAGEPGHPKGGCVVVNTNTQKIETGKDNYYNTLLCSVDTKYYTDSTLKKTVTTYIPCYKEAIGYFLLRSTTFEVRDSAGKSAGKVKVSAPFGYTSNKPNALKALKKIDGKTYYLNVKNGTSLTSSSSTSSTSATTSATNTYSLVVDNVNDKVMYSGSDVSKRCTVVAKALGEGDKILKMGTARCGGASQVNGMYPAITLSNIDPVVTKTLYIYGSDTGAVFLPQVSRTTKVDFSKLTELGTSSKNIVETGGNTWLSCEKEGSIISCKYAPILNQN